MAVGLRRPFPTRGCRTARFIGPQFRNPGVFAAAPSRNVCYATLR